MNRMPLSNFGALPLTSLLLGLFLSSNKAMAGMDVLPATPAQASTPGVPTAASKRDEVHKVLFLARMKKALVAPLVLKVENASVQDVVLRIKQALTAKNLAPLPRIEVRAVRPVRLNFETKHSTVAGILGDAAALAGAHLWIFGDHLVIAPDGALTPAEMAVKEGDSALAVVWAGHGFQMTGEQELAKKALLSGFVADEIRGAKPDTSLKVITGDLPGGGRMTTPWDNAKAVAFGHLSPEAQAALQELRDDAFTSVTYTGVLAFGEYPPSNFILTDDCPIRINDSEVRVEFHPAPETDAAGTVTTVEQAPWGARIMEWALDGRSVGISSGTSHKTPAPARPATGPGLVDPSAGKS